MVKIRKKMIHKRLRKIGKGWKRLEYNVVMLQCCKMKHEML